LEIKYFLTDNEDLLKSISEKFDLRTLISCMTLGESWKRKELNSMILLKSPLKSMILTSLHEGIEIFSFQANDKLSLNVLMGNLNVQLTNNYVSLQEGNTLSFTENIKYRLTTEIDTIFILQTETFPIVKKDMAWPSIRQEYNTYSLRLKHFLLG
jgi:hypothetical protein